VFVPDPPEQAEAMKGAEHATKREETRALFGLPDAGKPSDERD